MDLVVAQDDPRRADVVEMLDAHLAFSRMVGPIDHVHALAAEGLLDPMVTLFSARRAGELIGVGALREIDPSHGEIKSMHTRESARGQGIGRAIVVQALQVAEDRGYDRVSLETGTYDAFAPARALYRKLGFERCEPFGNYTDNPFSVCMSIAIQATP